MSIETFRPLFFFALGMLLTMLLCRFFRVLTRLWRRPLRSQFVTPGGWWAVYRLADGFLVSCGTEVADPLPAGLAMVAIPGPQPETELWHPEQLSFRPWDEVEEWQVAHGQLAPEWTRKALTEAAQRKRREG